MNQPANATEPQRNAGLAAVFACVVCNGEMRGIDAGSGRNICTHLYYLLQWHIYDINADKAEMKNWRRTVMNELNCIELLAVILPGVWGE